VGHCEHRRTQDFTIEVGSSQGWIQKFSTRGRAEPAGLGIGSPAADEANWEISVQFSTYTKFGI